MPHNMVNFGRLAAEIGSLVWGTPANIQWVSRFGFITAAIANQKVITELQFHS